MTPEEMASLLRRAIREGIFRPGEPLVQENLASRFGVSRIPLREALRILSGEELVTVQQGQGVLVRELDSDEVAELYDLRMLLEPSLAQPVVTQLRDSDLVELERLVDEMESIPETDLDRWSNLNFEFHYGMYALAKRVHTVRFVTQLLDRTEPYARLYVHNRRSVGHPHHEHREMLDALKQRDSDRLHDMIREHLSRARDMLLEQMRQTGMAGPDILHLLTDDTRGA